jgi:hypothetical protein
VVDFPSPRYRFRQRQGSRRPRRPTVDALTGQDSLFHRHPCLPRSIGSISASLGSRASLPTSARRRRKYVSWSAGIPTQTPHAVETPNGGASY